MVKKEENSLLKSFLEFVPIIAFFLAYYYFPNPSSLSGEELSVEKIIFATKIFVPTLLISSAVSYLILRNISKMTIITAVVVIIFGALTIWFRNPVFIKMKPTIIYVCFSGILFIGLLRKKSFLQSLMGSALNLQDEGWLILTKRITFFFIILAALNEIIWRLFGQDQWVNFKTFGLPVMTLIFFAFQYKLFQKYLIEDKD
jgi:intracellular septation protein